MRWEGERFTWTGESRLAKKVWSLGWLISWSGLDAPEPILVDIRRVESEVWMINLHWVSSLSWFNYSFQHVVNPLSSSTESQQVTLYHPLFAVFTFFFISLQHSFKTYHQLYKILRNSCINLRQLISRTRFKSQRKFSLPCTSFLNLSSQLWIYSYSVNVLDEVSDQDEEELLDEVTKDKVQEVGMVNPPFISQEDKLPLLVHSQNVDSRTRKPTLSS